MKQVIQSYSNGDLELADVGEPLLSVNGVLVDTVATLVSPGTERYMIELAKKNLLQKALARPDLVKQVVAKARSEGAAETYRQAKGKLDSPVPMGYSAVGVVREVGNQTADFRVGDLVACAGSGFACHAEVLSVPQTMAVRVPEGLSAEEATFVTLGGIALHAYRCSATTLGETVVVLGLGLLGNLVAQIALAGGARVIGLDVSAARVSDARQQLGIAAATIDDEDVVGRVLAETGGQGADAVLITASTPANQPIELAPELCRSGASVIVPGLVGLDLPRSAFYERELKLVVSRAWGEGVYDPDYERGRSSYPSTTIRWDAQRNLAAFLHLVATRRVNVASLITHRYRIEEALAAYELILEGKEPAMGVVLTYPQPLRRDAPTAHTSAPPVRCITSIAYEPRPTVRSAFIGAGAFTRGTVIPALRGIDGLEIRAVASAGGASAEFVRRSIGADRSTADVDSILGDDDIDLVFVLTRHGSHADLVVRALEAGKDVFVEKPLAMNAEQLVRVEAAVAKSTGRLMVGFNRRFAPSVTELMSRFPDRDTPRLGTIRVNVGAIPKSSWIYSRADGGGNLIGEICHFVDLASALGGAPIRRVSSESMRGALSGASSEENLTANLFLDNGSVFSLQYTTSGSRRLGREHIEMFAGGTAHIIDNFRRSRTYSRHKTVQTGRRIGGSIDRGHRAQFEALIAAVRSGTEFPVPFATYRNTTLATLALRDSLRSTSYVEIG